MSPDYWTLVVQLDPDAAAAAEAVTNFLWEAGAAGVVEEEGATALGVRAFLPPGTDPAGLQGRVRTYLDELRALAVPIGAGMVEVRVLPEDAWADAWRAHFRPLPVGRRLLVCPPWDVPAGAPPAGPAGPRVVVLIEPGRAFGTGGHASTLGCLELLERALDADAAGPILDIGTGSGILAVAAARLGAREVHAIDPDPDAVAAAVANAARNQVAERVRVEIGGIPDWAGAPASLVLANLLGATHVALAGNLARCARAGGRLIAGGLLVHEVPAVTGAFVPEGFRLVELVEREGWASLLLHRGV